MTDLMRKSDSLLPDLTGVFNHFFDGWGSQQQNMPAINVEETNDTYELEVAAPGMQKNDFHVEMEDDSLIISAGLQGETQRNERNYVRREFEIKSFKRVFRLPKHLVIEDKINAVYRNGILHITIPKSEEAKVHSTRKIEIR